MKVKSIKKVGKKPVYDLSVKDTQAYATMNGIINHNTGVAYNAENSWVISRVQDKDQSSKEVRGYNFKINIEKSRSIREGKSFDINVSFENGIDRWTGLLPVALETGHVIKPSQGWYSRPGIADDKKWRSSETSCLEFWAPILKDPTFEQKAREIYCLVNNVLIDDGQETVDMEAHEEPLQKEEPTEGSDVRV